MSYALLKYVHVACATISVAGFFLRGALMLAGASLLQKRLLRIAPHVVDTLLLASAIALSVMLGQYPFVHGWVTAKVLALLAYIVLGTTALKRGRTRTVRASAFVLALLVFAYIVSVALTRSPAGFLG
jgi:uncharacterized membrane protein SirB2